MVDDPYEPPLDRRKCPYCERQSSLVPVEPTWSWPATIAFIALLAFVGFNIWVFFG